ncbi:unnamed protein product [Linum trigynum]|uniref:Beta-glucosidase n=1 Tax=Linum trigynum TaxID=586398 RepID=A0AAV2FZP2_9ROSI
MADGKRAQPLLHEAYNYGEWPPGRCSETEWMGNCTGAGGDSSTEPYVAAHHLLLSHAAAVKLYRESYQERQKGKVGITIIGRWFEPKYKNSPSSHVAASRALDFMFGWFLGPITYGA